MMGSTPAKLQVMICTFGPEGIERVARGAHPVVDGVEYIVGWQRPGGAEIPSELTSRNDFKIFLSDEAGLSRNRNFLLSKAGASLVLIADDDVNYSVEGLESIIRAFADNPDVDLISFRFDSPNAPRNYPDHSFDLRRPPRGYFLSSIELALRRSSIAEDLRFNELFGIGAPFSSGEENIFLSDCLRRGLKGIYLPVTICQHPAATTSEKLADDEKMIEAKGASFQITNPRTSLLRMVAHALRCFWATSSFSAALCYCKSWLRGLRKLKDLKENV